MKQNEKRTLNDSDDDNNDHFNGRIIEKTIIVTLQIILLKIYSIEITSDKNNLATKNYTAKKHNKRIS